MPLSNARLLNLPRTFLSVILIIFTYNCILVATRATTILPSGKGCEMNKRVVFRLGLILLLAVLSLGQPGELASAAPAGQRAAALQAVTLQVSAGWDHTCALKADGSIVCWGRNDSGQTVVPAPNSGFTQLSGGFAHTCGLKADGAIMCWGDNTYSQTTIPTPNGGFAQVSAGLYHTCGLKADGAIICWGWKDYGQTVVPAPNSGFAQVSAGNVHTCGLKVDGMIVCWGNNSWSQSDVPAPNSGFVQVSAGWRHTCGLKADGTIVCWGDIMFGQTAVPDPNSGFAQVSAGGGHTCGLKTAGSIVCWGWNDAVPDPNSGLAQVSAGYTHTCGMKTDGAIICWGGNDFNQAPVVTLAPAALPGGLPGLLYSQAITASGGPLSGYTYDILSGALPDGFSLSTDGVLSGTPANTGIYTFTVRALNDHLYSGTRDYRLVIAIPLFLPVVAR